MNGRAVVTTDGQKLGHVVGEHDDIAIVESGHLLKHRHAVPTALLHETEEGELRATVGKDVVDSSPTVHGEEFDREAVLTHYGLNGPITVDPDPESVETAGPREGDPGVELPAVFDKMPSLQDPSGSTANYH